VVEIGIELGQAASELELRLVNVAGRALAAEQFGPLPAGSHRLRLAGLGARTLPGGVYWLEARARIASGGTAASSEVRAQTRWVRIP
jgi:hypothetical protein